MVECLSERGWTIEYIESLTYRCVACLWERYWDRERYKIELAVKMNPFGGGSGKKDDPNTTYIDATTDEGWDKLVSDNFPVKAVSSEEL
jgi:hypothetical protein